jgi:spore maturation protein CgeB
MKILLIDSGASMSTKDVYVGLYEGLIALGQDVKVYALERRLFLAFKWLKRIWVAKGKPEEEMPTWNDTIYRASIEALEMALRFEVDWVIAVAGRYFHPDAVVLMKRAGLKVGIVLTESPYEDPDQGGLAYICDIAWTNERTSLLFFKDFASNVFYLPHAYRPGVHTSNGHEPDPEVPSHDVVFVGTDFQERIDLLGQIDWTGINLGLYGLWTLLPSRHRLRQYLTNKFIDNESTAQLYRQAKVGLNLHRRSVYYSRTSPRVNLAESLNPRGFELAACGIFHISDRREEGVEIFGPSVPTFETPQELEELIRTALDNQKQREELAGEAAAKVIPWTFEAKAAQMIENLRSITNVD